MRPREVGAVVAAAVISASGTAVAVRPADQERSARLVELERKVERLTAAVTAMVCLQDSVACAEIKAGVAR